MPRVLIVDDDAVMRDTLAESLIMHGYEVVQAADARAALEEIARARPCIVISDICMPGMDGVELAASVHKMYPELPVVLMTGFAHEDRVAEAVSSGVFTIFQKPFSMEAFTRSIARACERPAVLVVDDDAPYADSLAASLAASGVLIKVAYDSGAALERIREGGIDVCVLDLVLPGGGGMALLEELRREPAPVCLIGITGTTDERNIVRAVNLGVIACLRKPFRIPSLLHCIVQARREAA